MDMIRQKVYRGWNQLMVDYHIDRFKMRDQGDGWWELTVNHQVEAELYADNPDVTVVMKWPDGTSVTESLTVTRAIYRGTTLPADPWFKYNAASGVAFISIAGKEPS